MRISQAGLRISTETQTQSTPIFLFFFYSRGKYSQFQESHMDLFKKSGLVARPQSIIYHKVVVNGTSLPISRNLDSYITTENVFEFILFNCALYIRALTLPAKTFRLIARPLLAQTRLYNSPAVSNLTRFPTKNKSCKRTEKSVYLKKHFCPYLTCFLLFFHVHQW